MGIFQLSYLILLASTASAALQQTIDEKTINDDDAAKAATRIIDNQNNLIDHLTAIQNDENFGPKTEISSFGALQTRGISPGSDASDVSGKDKLDDYPAIYYENLKKRGIKDLFNKIKDSAKKVAESVKTVAKNTANAVQATVKKAETSIKTVAENSVNSVKNAAKSTSDALKNAADKTGEALKTAVKEAAPIAKALVPIITDAIPITKTIASVVKTVVPQSANAIDGVMGTTNQNSQDSQSDDGSKGTAQSTNVQSDNVVQTEDGSKQSKLVSSSAANASDAVGSAAYFASLQNIKSLPQIIEKLFANKTAHKLSALKNFSLSKIPCEDGIENAYCISIELSIAS